MLAQIAAMVLGADMQQVIVAKRYRYRAFYRPQWRQPHHLQPGKGSANGRRGSKLLAVAAERLQVPAAALGVQGGVCIRWTIRSGVFPGRTRPAEQHVQSWPHYGHGFLILHAVRSGV